MDDDYLSKVAGLQIRTISAILVWVGVLLLLLNSHFRIEWMFFTSLALIVAAVVAYFSPKAREK